MTENESLAAVCCSFADVRARTRTPLAYSALKELRCSHNALQRKRSRGVSHGALFDLLTHSTSSLNFVWTLK